MILNENASLLAQSMRETHDELTRDMLSATAAQIDCVNGSNGDLPTELTYQDIQSVYVALQLQSARLVAEAVEGDLKFGKDCAELKPTLIDLEFLVAA